MQLLQLIVVFDCLKVNEDWEEAGPLQKAYSRLAYPDENARPSCSANAAPLISGHLLEASLCCHPSRLILSWEFQLCLHQVCDHDSLVSHQTWP